MESIGSSLVFEGELIWAGLGWRGPEISSGLVVACRIIVSAPVPVPFLWTLNLEIGTCIWDLDLGLGFGPVLGLDKNFEF